MTTNQSLVPVLFAFLFASELPAKKNPVVGGAEMAPDCDVIENLARSSEHTEFIKRVKTARLIDTLKGAGPYTVFAPVNAAFSKLQPSTTINTLVRILTNQVVPGNYTRKTLRKRLKAGSGSVSLKTMEGGRVTITRQGGKFIIRGGDGSVGVVVGRDIKQKNGSLYVVEGLIEPGR